MARKLPTIVVVLLVASVGLAARVGVAPARAATGDSVVLAWNQQLLDTIAATRTAPTIAARELAIVHTAVYDAWAAYDPVAVGTRLGGGLRRPPAERTLDNKNKAVSFAAYAALVDLFPARQLTYAQQMADLGYAVDGSDTSMAASVGTVAARAVLDYRHHDGANQLGDLNGGAPYSDYTGYSSRRWPATTTRPAGSCCGRACSPPPPVDARDRSPRSARRAAVRHRYGPDPMAWPAPRPRRPTDASSQR